MQKVFCIRRGDTFVYIFILVQRKAEAQCNKTISEPTLESFV